MINTIENLIWQQMEQNYLVLKLSELDLDIKI